MVAVSCVSWAGVNAFPEVFFPVCSWLGRDRESLCWGTWSRKGSSCCWEPHAGHPPAVWSHPCGAVVGPATPPLPDAFFSAVCVLSVMVNGAASVGHPYHQGQAGVKNRLPHGMCLFLPTCCLRGLHAPESSAKPAPLRLWRMGCPGVSPLLGDSRS